MILLIVLPVVWRKGLKRQYQAKIVDSSEVHRERVAIVFGAAILRNGRLSTVLRDRMDTATKLYFDGVVDIILVSGDQRSGNYDEPGAMKDYAIARGVNPADIQVDAAGLRTYDTCYRARHVFELDSAILISQEFHLPRALFTCKQLGISAVGVAADVRQYRAARWYELRETFASAIALWDVLRDQQPTVLGAPMPIN
jgi:SanA protein